mmetsp:Transcript_29276/g.97286  ORF Transcript_29276/g.97286 Transcript_29276/m.97286 type:complete len:336 (+) Transcript_29276:6008-7015(+)
MHKSATQSSVRTRRPRLRWTAASPGPSSCQQKPHVRPPRASHGLRMPKRPFPAASRWISKPRTPRLLLAPPEPLVSTELLHVFLLAKIGAEALRNDSPQTFAPRRRAQRHGGPSPGQPKAAHRAQRSPRPAPEPAPRSRTRPAPPPAAGRRRPPPRPGARGPRLRPRQGPRASARECAAPPSRAEWRWIRLLDASRPAPHQVSSSRLRGAWQPRTPARLLRGSARAPPQAEEFRHSPSQRSPCGHQVRRLASTVTPRALLQPLSPPRSESFAASAPAAWTFEAAASPAGAARIRRGLQSLCAGASDMHHHEPSARPTPGRLRLRARLLIWLLATS